MQYLQVLISFQYLSRRFLNRFTELTSTTTCGKLFHIWTTLWLKKLFQAVVSGCVLLNCMTFETLYEEFLVFNTFSSCQQFDRFNEITYNSSLFQGCQSQFSQSHVVLQTLEANSPGNSPSVATPLYTRNNVPNIRYASRFSGCNP